MNTEQIASSPEGLRCNIFELVLILFAFFVEDKYEKADLLVLLELDSGTSLSGVDKPRFWYGLLHCLYQGKSPEDSEKPYFL